MYCNCWGDDNIVQLDTTHHAVMNIIEPVVGYWDVDENIVKTLDESEATLTFDDLNNMLQLADAKKLNEVPYEDDYDTPFDTP